MFTVKLPTVYQVNDSHTNNREAGRRLDQGSMINESYGLNKSFFEGVGKIAS